MFSAVRAFVSGLPSQHQDVLKRVFVDGVTQTAVAKERGVTRAAVNQTLAGIYRRGREELRNFGPAYLAA
jgi:DNA-directed RNA polymerase specialized sigma24 family protein